MEDAEGQLLLSKKKADFLKIWARIGEIYKDEEIVRGRIMRRIKGGFVVDLMTVDAFLPGSQIDVHPVRDFDALVGQDMDFRIVKLNDARKNIVVSHKIIVEKSLAGIREKVLGELKVGDIMEGTVKNITDFGVFVDLGGVDGLLHITDLSWGRVSHPSEVVQLDQRITVKVLDYDKDRQRISIGLKQLQPHPWEGVETKYPVGSRVRGRVVSIARYGAFVELEKGLEGLVHISEMSWTQHVKHPSALLSVGDEIDVVVSEYRQGKPQDLAGPEAGRAGSVGESRNQVCRRFAPRRPRARSRAVRRVRRTGRRHRRPGAHFRSVLDAPRAPSGRSAEEGRGGRSGRAWFRPQRTPHRAGPEAGADESVGRVRADLRGRHADHRQGGAGAGKGRGRGTAQGSGRLRAQQPAQARHARRQAERERGRRTAA